MDANGQISTTVEQLVARVRDATSQIESSWRRRTKNLPLIELKTAIVRDEDVGVRPVAELKGLIDELHKSGRIVLEAPAGGGKTTTLFQLADVHSSAGGISILVELPQWLDGDSSILDFVSKTPAFRALSITPQELACLENQVRFCFFLNGWNEVGFDDLRTAATRLKQLEQDFPHAGIILATRVYQPSALPNMTLRVRLLPLDRSQRNDYLRQTSGDRAPVLSKKLDSDLVLDELTRTPLILAHVAMLDAAQKDIPPTKMGVLRQVVQLTERAEDHRVALDSPPLSGMAGSFLRDLAARLTAQGQILISQGEACAVIKEAQARLRVEAAPAEILSELCAHHLLEPLEYPVSSFRFVHQQFQEFFAADHLMNRLNRLVTVRSPGDVRTFVAAYLNEPAWAEPLYMIADEIGQTLDKVDNQEFLMAGATLVELTLQVDAVFAAELSHSCGPKVWAKVRDAVSKRLQELWESPVPVFRELGLAGMIATGAPDFSSILVPRLSGADRHTHHHTYGVWSDFHVSSLGSNWQTTVSSWSEEARIDFAAKMFRSKRPQQELVSFALSDPSPKVRASALAGLTWSGDIRDNPALIKKIDAESMCEYLRYRPLEAVPVELEAKALAAYRDQYEETPDPSEKLKLIYDMSRLGHPSGAKETKAILMMLSKEQLLSLEQGVLEPVLRELRDLDGPEWLSLWVLDRLLEGALRSDLWLQMVEVLEADKVEQLLSVLETEDFSVGSHPGAIPILRSKADCKLVSRIFNRLRELNIQIEAAKYLNCQTEAHIRSQLVEFLESLPLEITVDGVMATVSHITDHVDVEAVTKIWGGIGSDDKRFRTELPATLRERMKSYLQSAVKPAIAAENKYGEIKCGLAILLAQVGTLEDMSSIEALIRADIEQIRNSPRHTRYGCWYLQAARQLDENAASDLSIRLLNEPEYESDAAWSLVRLASIENLPSTSWIEGWATRDRDPQEIWQARSVGPSYGFRSQRREQYAQELRRHVDHVWGMMSDPQHKDSAESRLKQLAKPLAVLDAHSSMDRVLQILEIPLPERYRNLDGWGKVLSLQLLQFAGVQLPAARTVAILSPVIDVPPGQWRSDNDQSMTNHALALLPFLDDPVCGIQKATIWYRDNKAHYYPLGRLIRSLGNSRAKDAVPLLMEIAKNARWVRNFTDEWINAVFTLATPEAYELLLSLVDPSLPGIAEIDEPHSNDVLASRLADIANHDATFRQRLFALTHVKLPGSRRKLLGETLAKIEDPEALVSALNLIDDQAPGSLPYQVYQQIERAFVEHKPYGNSGYSYILSPRSANRLRVKLIQMVAERGAGTESALSLLGQAEKWRLQYGRPAGELRNPVLNLGKQWPPANATQIEDLQTPTNRSGRVLILGKDTGDGLVRLRKVQAKLNDLGYDAILIKEQPDVPGESVIQKVLRFATSCRFVVLDNTVASGHLYELPHVSKSAECITVVLQERDKGATWMLEDAFFKHNHWKKFEFDPDELGMVLDQAVAWAEDFRKQFAQHQGSVLPWLKSPTAT